MLTPMQLRSETTNGDWRQDVISEGSVRMPPTDVKLRNEFHDSEPAIDFLADFAFDLSLDAVPATVAHQAPLTIQAGRGPRGWSDGASG